MPLPGVAWPRRGHGPRILSLFLLLLESLIDASAVTLRPATPGLSNPNTLMIHAELGFAWPIRARRWRCQAAHLGVVFFFVFARPVHLHRGENSPV